MRRTILTTLLVSMLGSSGMACACALAALDEPVTGHHAMPGHHEDATNERTHACDTSCGHAAIVKAGKTADENEQRTDNPLPPIAFAPAAGGARISGTAPHRQFERQHTGLPLSTPVSRSDTLLD